MAPVTPLARAAARIIGLEVKATQGGRVAAFLFPAQPRMRGSLATDLRGRTDA